MATCCFFIADLGILGFLDFKPCLLAACSLQLTAFLSLILGYYDSKILNPACLKLVACSSQLSYR